MSEISALQPFSGDIARDDKVVLVDISDTTQSPDGSTVRSVIERLSKSPAKIVVAMSGDGILADYYCTGEDDNEVLQLAIDEANGGKVYVRESATPYDIADTVTLPDNTEFIADPNAIFKANAALDGPDHMFTNSNLTGGNSGIIFAGGQVDGNQANRSNKTAGDELGASIFFKNCSYSAVYKVEVYNGIFSNVCFAQGTNNSLIENCKIYNSWEHNILIVGTAAGVQVHKNIINSNIVYGAGQDNSEGVGIELAKYATNNIVTNNISRGNLEGGLHVFYRSNSNILSNNQLIGNSQNGISMVDESEYNLISDNYLDGNLVCGISNTTAFLTFGGKNNNILNNTIINNGSNGIRGTWQSTNIQGNWLKNNGSTGASSTFKHGIYSTSMLDCVIKGNWITGSTDRGINITDIQRSQIDGNYVGSNTGVGIMIDYSLGVADISISSNICVLNGGSGLVLLRNANRVTVTGNVCKQNTGNGIDIRGATNLTCVGNTATTNSSYGIDIKDDSAAQATTKSIFANNVVTANTSGGIRATGSADTNIYEHNNCLSNTTANFAVVGSANIIRGNLGYVTEASGTATIASGATSVVITHGLGFTPSLKNITVTLGENPTNDPGNIYVNTFSATQFTINCRNDPGASNLDLAWRASYN